MPGVRRPSPSREAPTHAHDRGHVRRHARQGHRILDPRPLVSVLPEARRAAPQRRPAPCVDRHGFTNRATCWRTATCLTSNAQNRGAKLVLCPGRCLRTCDRSSDTSPKAAGNCLAGQPAFLAQKRHFWPTSGLGGSAGDYSRVPDAPILAPRTRFLAVRGR